ncbi:SMI1/KNR4 family protein [Marinicrinis sediminis]|uniref:SMI1/KNR4 family protein n=1 Tax=Marinicrinis sediminis TaxID=1652465 RepID=A0ABW5RF86_9BACL
MKNSKMNTILNNLQIRLSENDGVLTVPYDDGSLHPATFRFHEPLSNEKLLRFERDLAYSLPEDYRSFLLYCNGCRLFDHPSYGGENYLHSIDQIVLYTYEEDENEDQYLKIGYFCQDDLVIDLEAHAQGEPHYILVKGMLDDFAEARPLHMNFEQWFERFLETHGEKFWTLTSLD